MTHRHQKLFVNTNDIDLLSKEGNFRHTYGLAEFKRTFQIFIHL